MRKSLFAKYFMVTAVSIVLSFAFLITLVLLFASRFWASDKLSLLHENAVTVSQLGTEAIGSTDFAGNLTRTSTAVGSAVDASVFIVDYSGNTFICSDTPLHRVCVHSDVPIPAPIMARVLQGPYDETGLLGGMYQSMHYSAGVPLRDQNGEVIGAVFVSADAQEHTEYITRLLSILLLSAGIALLLMFTAVYVVTLQMAKPLREMSEAAHAMEQGDFSRRVVVRRKDEIGELADAFNKMAMSLASLEQMRRSFVANVSHELKTPMTTIGGFIDGILDGTIGPDRQEHYLRIVSDEIRRLSRMVNSMLGLARLESGETKINLTTFNLTELICRTLLSFEQRVEEKHIEIRGLEDAKAAEVTADADLIYQVVYNLMDNAVKFTPDGGYIELHVSGAPDETQVSIKNSGAGIPQRELGLVFDRFYKTDKSRSNDKKGTGLGLYIVKSILETHKGAVTVQSREGEYTEFQFTLPTAGPSDAQNPSGKNDPITKPQT